MSRLPPDDNGYEWSAPLEMNLWLLLALAAAAWVLFAGIAYLLIMFL